MAGMPWVKVYIEILDDVKILRLSDPQKWRFLSLILFAAECDADGALVTGDSIVTHDDVSIRLRCDIEELKKDIEKMLSLGLVFMDGDIIVVSSFSERQGPTQEEKRKKWRERQRTRRNRVTGESSVSPQRVSPLEKRREEEEKRGEEEKDKDSFSVVACLYEQEIGPLTPMIGEQIKDWSENYPLVWVERAIEIATTQQKRNVGYINGILNNFQKEGFDHHKGIEKSQVVDMEKQREEEAKRARKRIEQGKRMEIDD